MGHVLDLMGSFGPTLQMKLFGPLHGLSSTLTDIGSFKASSRFTVVFLFHKLLLIFFPTLGYFRAISICVVVLV